MVGLIALTIPFALIGGVASVFLTGGVLSLGSLVGFVTVLGIAARNGIMLVSHYRHLQDSEGMTFGSELVLRSAAGVVWTHDEFPFPSFFSNRPLMVGPVRVAPVSLVAGAPVLPRRITSKRMRLTDMRQRGQFAYLTYAVGSPAT